MKILVLENYPDTPSGLIGEELTKAGIQQDIVQLFNNETLPSKLADYAGLIVLGGAQNALDDVKHPYLAQETELILKFHRSEKPVLGVCLGAQLVARAFEARNILDRTFEVGYLPVIANEAGIVDLVISTLGKGKPIFHCHKDTFTLPENAHLLASSKITRNQAFKIGSTTYAIQFHFEVNDLIVDGWLDHIIDMIEEEKADWLRGFMEQRAALAQQAEETGREISRGWISLLS